ncbi:hypothetical protein CVM73_03520 [Bradyrhizobium forestalis]|uniref:Uncharacterized protein n=1 Tax=Bradyrhizobium forestalis TaxID=1419263 RepID=A0A2M8RG96_9BRAD|nr:hypothetical protein CVM73_03520 [Bradyrhizobium forestalis]
MLEKAAAVDCVQHHAELWSIVAEIGQDEVQAIMSAAFAPPQERPSEYASQLLMQWELADPRDRWRWTGELPPAPEVMPIAKPAYRPAQSTVDAFHFVLRAGDPERLATWLRNHPDDAPALLEILEAA